MTKKVGKVTFLRATVLISIVMGLVFLLIAGCGKREKKKDISLPIVQVVQVVRQDVPVYTEWIGTTDGKVNATI